eukprot:38188_1
MVKTRNGNDYGTQKPNSSDSNDDNPSSSLPDAKPSNTANTDTPTNPPLDSSPSSQTNLNISNNADNIKQSISNASPPKNDNNSNTSDTNIATKEPPQPPKRAKRRGRRKANRAIMNYHGVEERSIQIQFFDVDSKGACKYSTCCPRCQGVCFDKIQDWRDHHESEHHEQDGYQCPECDRNSQNWYNYTNHVQTHDSIAPAWNCIIDGCNLPFANIYSLLSHWKKNHTQYVIRKIPSRSTVADDLRILMGTYEESGGEAAEESIREISHNAHAVKRGRKKRDKAKKKAVAKKKLSGKKRGNKSHNTRNVKRQRLNNGKALRKSRRQRAVVRYNEEEEENETEHESDSDFVADNGQMTGSDSEDDDISSEDSVSSMDEESDVDVYDSDGSDIDMRDVKHKKKNKRGKKKGMKKMDPNTLESIKILNEIMKDCPTPRRQDGIDLLLKAHEIYHQEKEEKEKEETHMVKDKNVFPFNVEAIKPLNPFSNNASSLVLSHKNTTTSTLSSLSNIVTSNAAAHDANIPTMNPHSQPKYQTIQAPLLNHWCCPQCAFINESNTTFCTYCTLKNPETAPVNPMVEDTNIVNHTNRIQIQQQQQQHSLMNVQLVHNNTNNNLNNPHSLRAFINTTDGTDGARLSIPRMARMARSCPHCAFPNQSNTTICAYCTYCTYCTFKLI